MLADELVEQRQDMKKGSRAEEMAQILSAQSSSGMSKQAYCEKHGITPSMFYYWQKRLQGTPVQERAPGFSRLQIAQPKAELEFCLPGGQWLKVRTSSSVALGLLLEALANRDA
jgi:hypothetical protein